MSTFSGKCSLFRYLDKFFQICFFMKRYFHLFAITCYKQESPHNSTKPVGKTCPRFTDYDIRMPPCTDQVKFEVKCQKVKKSKSQNDERKLCDTSLDRVLQMKTNGETFRAGSFVIIFNRTVSPYSPLTRSQLALTLRTTEPHVHIYWFLYIKKRVLQHTPSSSKNKHTRL